MPRSWEKDREAREPIKPGEKLWVLIAYRKQDDGKIACTLTSNVPFERGRDYYGLKAYASGRGRVYDQFTVEPVGDIHIDVYANGGESSGVDADFKVTDQAVEVVGSREIEAAVSDEGELGNRERRILEFMGIGMTDTQIAREFHITEQQLTTFVSSIKQKTGLQSRTKLEELGRSIHDSYKRMN